MGSAAQTGNNSLISYRLTHDKLNLIVISRQKRHEPASEQLLVCLLGTTSWQTAAATCCSMKTFLQSEKGIVNFISSVHVSRGPCDENVIATSSGVT